MLVYPNSPVDSSPDERSSYLIYRGFCVRKRKETMSTETNNADGVKNEEERAAVKLQANVRGFLVRQKQKEANVAASKIQTAYREYRKDKAKGDAK